MRIHVNLAKDPIFQALNPDRKRFLRARTLPLSLNPYAEYFDMKALVAFGEFAHIKTVPAFQILFEDQMTGHYVNKHTIVVDSSGNTAHAVARLAHAFGFQNVKVVMSADVPASKRDIFSALSSIEIITVPKGNSVAARAIEEARKEGHYHLNQYAHFGNMNAHEMYTGPEIERVLEGNIGIIAIAMGSGGTAAGVVNYMRKKYPQAIVLGVRPKSGEQVPGARDKAKMESVVPPAYRPNVHEVVEVSRKESFVAMRRLWNAVEPQPGPTSGLAYAGLLTFLQYLEEMPNGLDLFRGKNMAFLCPDSAMLYSDVIIAELDTGQGL